MSETKDIIKLVKNDINTKNEIKEKLDAISKLSTGEKAALTTKLMADKVVYEEAIIIMGEGMKEAEAEIVALEYKNQLLENDLNTIDKDKINQIYETKKFELQNDGNGNTRVMKRLQNIMSKAKQLTE